MLRRRWRSTGGVLIDGLVVVLTGADGDDPDVLHGAALGMSGFSGFFRYTYKL